MTHSRREYMLPLIVVLSLSLTAVAPWIGMQRIGWGDVFDGNNPLLANIFWNLRLPRTLTAFVAGCGLAMGGVAFQALFRNPLAEPFTLGVSAGASAGIAFALYWGGGAVFFGLVSTENLYAFIGALIAIGVVYAFSRLRSDFGAATLLLSGVAVSFFFSSLVMLLQHMVDPHNAARIFRAMIGGIAAAGQKQLVLTIPFVVLGVFLTGRHSRELDIISCGDDVAVTRGVDTAKVRKRLFIGVSLMVGGITALCGPIGFIGLIAPHICRILVGPEHGRLLVGSACFGGMFLVAADLVAKTVIAPNELPVGVVSSLCGAPFFLWLLLRMR